MNIINGKIYSDGNISISNNKIYINGVLQNGLTEEKVINIEITGAVEKLEVDSCQKITINGNVHSLKSTNADISCNDVTGNVSSNNGDIDCGNVGGDVSTNNGDIKHRKN